MPFNTTLKKIISDYPDIHFSAGTTFSWSRDKQMIIYAPHKEDAISLLLHELAHAVLDHDNYKFDIQLLKKELEAWHYAQSILAPHYNVIINEDVKEAALDTYRIWLHKRSLCPDCNTSSIQTQTDTYTCAVCGCQWRANKATENDLRRYKLSPTTHLS